MSCLVIDMLLLSCVLLSTGQLCYCLPVHRYLMAAYLHTPVQPNATKSVKIAVIHSNRTSLTLTLNPKLKTIPTLILTLNLRWAARGFVIMPPGGDQTS